MPFATRTELRIRLRQTIQYLIEKHVREHHRQRGGPWPPDRPERDMSRAEREMMVVPTSPASLRVEVKAAMWLHTGLFGRTWPTPPANVTDRLSSYFNRVVLGDYRVDLLYLSHLNTLKIIEGTEAYPSESGEVATIVDVPTQPDRGIPLAYIVMLPALSALTEDHIVDVRPYLTTVTSPDVDAATWLVTQDFSSQLDGARTKFALDLPSTHNTAVVKLNGIVQQPIQAYAVSGGSLGLTFAPYATEVLVTTYELGQKGEYSGYGLAPWGTGIYGV